MVNQEAGDGSTWGSLVVTNWWRFPTDLERVEGKIVSSESGEQCGE